MVAWPENDDGPGSGFPGHHPPTYPHDRSLLKTPNAYKETLMALCSTAHTLTQPAAFTQSVGVKRHVTVAWPTPAVADVRAVQEIVDPRGSEEIEEIEDE
jgi:hypothetical protein